MNSINLIVKESITQALFRLMDKKSFPDITIKELTDVAGVGRVSFYRNYTSKEDVALTYLLETSETWWQDHHDELDTKWQGVFELIENLQDEFLLIYKSGATDIIYQYLRCFLNDEPETPAVNYRQAMSVGACFGLIDEWLAQDMVLRATDLEKEFHGHALEL